MRFYPPRRIAILALLVVTLLTTAAGSARGLQGQTADTIEPRSPAPERVSPERVSAESVSISSPAGILLLRNGNLLRGDITLLGDRYVVSLDSRNEVRIPATEVELRCANLVDVYQHKRQQLPPGQPTARIELAEWCLRHGLRAQAADEAVIVMRLAPDHPRLPALERRIQNPAPASSPDPANPTNATPTSVEQLELAAREIPFGAMERFTSAIQPMLINRCGANRCHGPGGESDYHLLRPPVGQSSTRRFTLRNLHATLRAVNPDSPESSPLLVQARQAHGGAKTAPLSPNEQVQYELLAAWVRQIQPTKATSSPSPATIARPGTQLLQTTAVPTGGPSKSPTSPPDTSVEGTSGTGPPTAGARDPFDPRVFNERFGKPAPKGGQEASSTLQDSNSDRVGSDG